MAKKREEKKIWGENVVRLDRRFFGALRLKYCLEHLHNVSGKVLEVGCGGGAFVRAISQYKPELSLYGVDVDSKAIAIAKRMDKNNSYMVASAYSLPFQDNSFDSVVSFDVVEHLDKPLVAFKEIYRVMKKGGIFHAAIPIEGNIWTIHGLFLKLGVKPKEVYAGHVQQFSKHDIVSLLEEEHFSLISFNSSGHFLFQLADFSYFLLLSLLHRKSSHTVEGMVAVMPNSWQRKLLLRFKNSLASICYWESYLWPNFSGQVGHFTAIKV